MCASMLGLHADWLGQERFIQYARDHWTSGRISVPIEIFSVVVGLFMMVFVWRSTRPRVRLPEPTRAGSWSWGCEGRKSNKTVLLVLEDGSGKRALDIEMSATIARRVAKNIVDEVDYCESPEPSDVNRKTSWATIDKLDLDDAPKVHQRPKAPAWPSK
jgi:hypothetical protein